MLARAGNPCGRDRRPIAAAALLLLPCRPALAAPPDTPGGEVVVEGRRAGALRTATVPILHLDEAAMRALGATSVADLVKRIGARAQAIDGSPPLLAIDGRRPLGDEIGSLPFEAFRTTDVLPPEAAVKLGFPPTRPVINLVTKARFRAVEVQAFARTSTGGGASGGSGTVNLTRLRNKRRITLSGSFTLEDALRQDRRALLPDPAVPFSALGNVHAADGGELDPALSARVGERVTAAAVPADPALRSSLVGYAATANRPAVTDIGPFRTLRPHTATAKLSAFLSRPMGHGLAASVSASVERQRTWSLEGPATAAIPVPAGNSFSPFGRDVVLDRYLTEVAPLRQHGTALTLHGGAGLSGNVAGWSWSLLTGLDRKRSQSVSELGIDTADVDAAVANGRDPFNGFPAAALARRLVDRSHATITTFDSQLVATGEPVALPAGRVDVTATMSAQRSATRTVSRSLVSSDVALGRSQSGALLAATLPIASRADDVLPFLGRLAATGTAGVTGVSRYGALPATSYGLVWSPVGRVQLLATVKDAASPPALERVASPTVVFANVPFFDLVTGETAIVTSTSGGNPDLKAEHRHDLALSLTLQPFRSDHYSVSLSYEATSIRNQAGILSTATPAIEEAFPDRFVRDGAGRLAGVDFRPVNYALERRRTLAGTIGFSGVVGRRWPGAERQASDVPFFALSLTPRLRLEDRLLLRAGTPELDLLRGDVIEARGPPARLDVQSDLNLFYRGYGLYGQPVWHRGARARSDQPEADLRFSGLFTITMFGFVDLATAAKRARWAHGLFVSLGVDNLLNDRTRVRDRFGRTPNADQPAYLDPVGRTVSINLRKLF